MSRVSHTSNLKSQTGCEANPKYKLGGIRNQAIHRNPFPNSLARVRGQPGLFFRDNWRDGVDCVGHRRNRGRFRFNWRRRGLRILWHERLGSSDDCLGTRFWKLWPSGHRSEWLQKVLRFIQERVTFFQGRTQGVIKIIERPSSVWRRHGRPSGNRVKSATTVGLSCSDAILETCIPIFDGSLTGLALITRGPIPVWWNNRRLAAPTRGNIEVSALPAVLVVKRDPPTIDTRVRSFPRACGTPVIYEAVVIILNRGTAGKDNTAHTDEQCVPHNDVPQAPVDRGFPLCPCPHNRRRESRSYIHFRRLLNA